ncbi:peptide chain release factor 2 [Aneurinibacillus soli]|nr:peptide chain release factor 2 [Aneurinibacillus soli]
MPLTEAKQQMSAIGKRLTEIRGSLDLPGKQKQIAALEEKMAFPNFWDDNDAAQKVIGEVNVLKDAVTSIEGMEAEYEDIQVMMDLVAEEDDESLIPDIVESVQSLQTRLTDYELQLLLNQPYDKRNAILELHPGAGGTESQDWAEMLLRMYTRWADKQGYKVETLDYLPGDEAGVKSVTLSIKGHNAYGYLKAEKGVHRLVRISPFDSSGRRHTSFVSCDVMPEIDDDITIEVRPDEIKVDTYRASGAGGQHINTTDSAVRITHVPTGVVVTCQNERSQIKNRERAMKMLRSKLYEREIARQEEEAAQLRGEQKEIGWGSQIRSYVFHPYSMVKDHRTSKESGNVQAVMDGDITPFIDAYLRQQLHRE